MNSIKAEIFITIIIVILSIIFSRYFFGFEKYNDQSQIEYPILTSHISIVAEEGVFFEQVYSFAKENDFSIDVKSLDPENQKKIINLHRDDMKISVFNPFDKNKYVITYYKAGEKNVSNSKFKDMDEKFQLKITSQQVGRRSGQ